MKKAVIFDLYNTLMFLGPDRKPYLQLCQAAGEASSLRNSLTVDAPDLISFCAAIPINAPANVSELQRTLDADLLSVRLFPEVLDVLQRLRNQGVKIAVISNLATPYIAPVDNLSLHQFFDAELFSCKIGKTKPDPVIYQAALDQLSVTLDEVLMIGDSLRCDVEGPRSLGMDTYQIVRDSKSANADCISSLNDVFQFLS